jgi:CubicO group peptidase (beta-lactamase class C family)
VVLPTMPEMSFRGRLWCSPIVLIVLIVLAGPATAAQADPIDRIVTAEMQRQSSPAVAVAVVRGGRAVKVQGYGLANVEHRAPATPHTMFQTASVGKQFTAALVMLLVRDGKLGLDDPVSLHLPGTPPAWQGITVRQLLTHTSGLAYADPAIDLKRDYTEQELLASAYQVPLVHPPGTRHAYGTLGYQVLGFLCSQVGGRHWGEQLAERVFKPLGMASRVISERDIVPHRAAGYVRFDGVLQNQAWVAPSQNTTADGSLYVSAHDMARWSAALSDQRLFSSQEKEAMWTPALLADGQRVDYGFGWALFTEAGRRVVRHRGDWQGFTAHIVHVPQDRLTVSVLMNRARGEPHVIADRIVAHLLPALRKPAVVPPSPALLMQTPMFVRGSMNGWGDTTPLRATRPGLFEARVFMPAGQQQFKIGDAAWQVADLGARFDEAVVKPGRVQTLAFRGENLFLQVAHEGEYTIQLDLRTSAAPRLRVTAP